MEEKTMASKKNGIKKITYGEFRYPLSECVTRTLPVSYTLNVYNPDNMESIFSGEFEHKIPSREIHAILKKNGCDIKNIVEVWKERCVRYALPIENFKAVSVEIPLED